MQREVKDIFKYWLERGVDGLRVDHANRLFETNGLPTESMVNASHGDWTLFDNIIHTHTINRVRYSLSSTSWICNKYFSFPFQPESYQFIYDLRETMDEYVEHAPANNKTHRLLMTSSAMASIPQLTAWYGQTENRLGSHVPLNTALIFELDRYSDATAFFNVINQWKDAKPVWGGEANWLLGTHDIPRLASRFGEGRHEAMAMMTMMLPGISTIYYVFKLRPFTT